MYDNKKSVPVYENLIVHFEQQQKNQKQLTQT